MLGAETMLEPLSPVAAFAVDASSGIGTVPVPPPVAPAEEVLPAIEAPRELPRVAAAPELPRTGGAIALILAAMALATLGTGLVLRLAARRT